VRRLPTMANEGALHSMRCHTWVIYTTARYGVHPPPPPGRPHRRQSVCHPPPPLRALHAVPTLGEAAKAGDLMGVTARLDAGDDANECIGDYHATPLHFAGRWGHQDVAVALIERGADIDATDKSNATPLHRAAENGHAELAVALIERGADIHAKNKDDDSPLHRAALWGHLEVALALIESGAHIDATGDDWNTPLHHAARNGQAEVAVALMERGANTEARNGVSAVTATDCDACCP